jgi:flagellar protein FlaG
MVGQIQPNAMPKIQVDSVYADYSNGHKVTKDNTELPPQFVARKDEVPLAKEDIPREEVEKASEKLNRLMGIIEKKLEFRVHDKTHRVMVKIIDRETGDVLSEIPPKKVLDMLASFKDAIGVLVDERI